ncbi:MAG TPA: RDD family protein [Candidatus Binataceae bacterium]|nr:RDD family protein [Candidatus Binataceae bacterium]
MSEAAGDREGPVHSFLSPEAVRLDLPVSGPVPRMLAYGIDLFFMIVLTAFLLAILISSFSVGAAIEHWLRGVLREAVRQSAAAAKQNQPASPLGGLAIAIFVLSEFVISTCYFIFWEIVTGGRSPGKLIVGLRVARRNGLPIDLHSSVVRNLMRAVDILPAEYLVGLISILLSPSGERLGDHVAGTIVLRLDRPETATDIPRSHDAGGLVLTRTQLARIGPREMQLIRGVLRRSSGVREDRRDELVAEAAEVMRIRLGLAELPGSDKAAFLHDLLNAVDRSAGSD